MSMEMIKPSSPTPSNLKTYTLSLLDQTFPINAFACGGVVIGCYALHKLMDGVSFGTFLKYWAGLASGQARQDLVEPDFTTVVSSFPPSQKVDRFTITGIDLTEFGLALAAYTFKVVAATFRFNAVALTQLKAKAASDTLPNPSRFEALAGFVWEQAFAAACNAGAASSASPTLLLTPANIRSQTNPSLSQGSIGNLFLNVIAQTEKPVGLPDLAIKIHESVSSQVKAKIEDIKGEAGADAVIASRKKLVQDFLVSKPNLYKITSWCNLAFKEADFGFGKPERVIPFYGELYYFHRNFIFFSDYFNPTDDGDVGIEVRLILEENDMQILASNPAFLALAIPI